MPSQDWVEIDTTLSDRELLILTAQGVNMSYRKICEQNSRIRRLEDWRNILFGGLALVMLVLSSKELLELVKAVSGR